MFPTGQFYKLCRKIWGIHPNRWALLYPHSPTQPSSATYSSTGLKWEFTSFVQNLDCTLSTEVENASFTSRPRADFSHILIYHANFCRIICNTTAHINVSADWVNKVLETQSCMVWPALPQPKLKHQSPKGMVARPSVQWGKDVV